MQTETFCKILLEFKAPRSLKANKPEKEVGKSIFREVCDFHVEIGFVRYLLVSRKFIFGDDWKVATWLIFRLLLKLRFL